MKTVKAKKSGSGLEFRTFKRKVRPIIHGLKDPRWQLSYLASDVMR